MQRWHSVASAAAPKPRCVVSIKTSSPLGKVLPGKAPVGAYRKAPGDLDKALAAARQRQDMQEAVGAASR